MWRCFGVLALSFVFAGCDQGPSDATSRRPRPQATTSDLSSVRVTIRDGDLILQREDVPAGPTTIVVVNDGIQQHMLRIERAGETVAALRAPLERGMSRTIRAELRSGSYAVYCPIPRHGEKERITLQVQ